MTKSAIMVISAGLAKPVSISLLLISNTPSASVNGAKVNSSMKLRITNNEVSSIDKRSLP